VNHFRCESHDRVTTLRRDRASAKPPRSRTPLVGYGVSRRSAVSRPTVHKHLHTGHAHEPLLELLVEWYVVSAHDDEQLGIRKRLRRERFEDLFLVARADAVCRRRIFQWFALSQVGGLAVAVAPGTQDLHLDDATVPTPCHRAARAGGQRRHEPPPLRPAVRSPSQAAQQRGCRGYLCTPADSGSANLFVRPAGHVVANASESDRTLSLQRFQSGFTVAP